MKTKRLSESNDAAVGVEVVTEPIVVPIPLAIVEVQVLNVAIAVLVEQKCMRHHLCHHPLNTFGIEYCLESPPTIIGVILQRRIPSCFIFGNMQTP
ncbi:MAG: hypothetical protein KBC26_02845 [Candidatus Pacebacteria bacterium]|nr:hypothetical protein [Candidatus Paceibacterota bacterium]